MAKGLGRFFAAMRCDSCRRRAHDGPCKSVKVALPPSEWDFLKANLTAPRVREIETALDSQSDAGDVAPGK
jgi:hypothetical protein